MPVTGWSGGDAEGPALPLTERLLANRELGPGDTLDRRWPGAAPPRPASCVTRPRRRRIRTSTPPGWSPGA
jgi:hypothetical protein